MLQYFIVIALALQVCVFAENKETESALSNLQCNGGTNAEKDVYDRFQEKLDDYVQKKDSDSFKKLNDTFQEFATKISKSCANGKLENIENPPFFIKLIEYAVKDGKYSKFIKSGGDVCVSTVKERLSACPSNDTGITKDPAVVNAHNNSASDPANGITDSNGNPSNHTGGDGNADDSSEIQKRLDAEKKIVQNHQVLFKDLLKMAYLHFNESNCDLTDEIRECVLTIMKDDQYKETCKPEHSEFVGSLFNFTKTMCPSLPEEEKAAQKDGANSFLFNPVVILLPLIGAVLLK